jgi:predicted RNase H-like nuclease
MEVQMTYVVGIDGCSVGWVGVRLELPVSNGQLLCRITSKLYISLDDMWHLNTDAQRIWLDMPIGLPMNTSRRVDVEARA